MHEATAKGRRLNLCPTHATLTLRDLGGFVRLLDSLGRGRASFLGGRHDGGCRNPVVKDCWSLFNVSFSRNLEVV
jgi:hypothetical protein